MLRAGAGDCCLLGCAELLFFLWWRACPSILAIFYFGADEEALRTGEALRVSKSVARNGGYCSLSDVPLGVTAPFASNIFIIFSWPYRDTSCNALSQPQYPLPRALTSAPYPSQGQWL